jgi:hypothetical protein
MTDVQFLFVILGVLYAWECACWLRRGGVGFTTWMGRRWRSQHPATMFGNQTGGFIFAAPFPPLGSLLITHQLPFSLGPEGVLFFVSATVNPGWRSAQSARYLSWDAIGELRVRGKKILLQKEILYAAPTATLASHLFRTLKDLSKLSAAERAQAIRQVLSVAFDLKQIETLRQTFHSPARPLRILTNALFVLVFVIAPVLIGFIGLSHVWFGLLLVLLVLTITTATFFARLHRKLWPAATDERFTQTLILALAPATTMRAHDIASRLLLETFHPLAVAKKLFRPEQFLPFARRLLLDLRNPALPTCPNLQPPAIATEQFFRQVYLETVEAWLTENKIAPNELCRPPAPADESCHAYCPRCEAQFTTTTGHCADCGGLPLVSFRKAS